MTETLEDRRMSASVALADLEAAQGAALLDGKPFDADKLISARNELDAISAAEVETVRRDREASAKAEKQRRAGVGSELGKHLKDYESASNKAERACKTLVATLIEIEALTKQMHDGANSLGVPVPRAIVPMETKTILSRLVAGELKSLGNRYGVISWSIGFPVSWKANLNEQVKPAIELIIGASKNDNADETKG